MRSSTSSRKTSLSKTSSLSKRGQGREDPTTIARLNAAEARVTQLEATVQELREEMANMYAEFREFKQGGQIESTRKPSQSVSDLNTDSSSSSQAALSTDTKQTTSADPTTPGRSRSRSGSTLRSSRPNSARRISTPSRNLLEVNDALVGCQCWMDISVGGGPKGKLVFTLFWDLVPKTCDNFRALCTGERGRSEVGGKKLHYKGKQTKSLHNINLINSTNHYYALIYNVCILILFIRMAQVS